MSAIGQHRTFANETKKVVVTATLIISFQKELVFVAECLFN